ncbi:uncharacterized protein LOC141697123 [Apium graveolens]|uniref:uncharacterized protein LOC141697123 n=1 Tax=Apium graveolens TaxID=4045 RepID=UPI003D78C5FF
MSPYKALYGRKCRTPTSWDEVGEGNIFGPELIQQMKDTITVIKKRLIAAQDRQKKYADPAQKDVKREIGEVVLLKVSLWKGLTRFEYNLDANHVIEIELLEIQADLSYEEQPVQLLDRQERILKNKSVSLVKVLWRNPKVEEATWELESEMRNRYPQLFF